MIRFLPLLFCALPVFGEAALRIVTFQSDATPGLGTPLCFALVQPGKQIDHSLTARGIVIYADKPIVLAAVDWVGIGNEGHDRWRDALAKAAGTTRDRVTVHVLHQHDAPGYDETAERLAASVGLGGQLFDIEATRRAIDKAAEAIRKAKPQPVTHMSIGKARVEQVASNRRILGPDGKIQYTRMSSCRIPEAIAAPEGTVDPFVYSLGFWNGAKPVASLSYYTTHPQSHYGKGGISWEFVGMARHMREEAVPGAAHIHFNGASGNVAAGKYNDGSPERRPMLADRLAAGMKQAWETAVKQPVKASDVEWRVEPVALPVTARSTIASLRQDLENTSLPAPKRLSAARHLAFHQLRAEGRTIPVNLLRIGQAHVLHLPGELFVEYQLAAQKMRPDVPVLMAAYGDYGPGYIGTAVAYGQGGYETSEVSRTAPEVENVLLAAMQKLLQAKPVPSHP